MPVTNLNKYLSDLIELTSISDADLFYVAGSDYKSFLQTIRNLTNPCSASTVKLLDYAVQESDCDGRSFTNRGALSIVEFTLPNVSDGLEVAFYVGSAKNLQITPQAADKIAQIATSDGQSIRSSTLGSFIMLRATANDWFVTRKTGTWVAV